MTLEFDVINEKEF